MHLRSSTSIACSTGSTGTSPTRRRDGLARGSVVPRAHAPIVLGHTRRHSATPPVVGAAADHLHLVDSGVVFLAIIQVVVYV